MAYKSITSELIELVSSGNNILEYIITQEQKIMKDPLFINANIKVAEYIQGWKNKIIGYLERNQLLLESKKINNIITDYEFSPLNNTSTLNHKRSIIRNAIDELLNIGFRLENNVKKNITRIFIDDIDNFKEQVKSIKPEDVVGYEESAFLEDDVENCFLEILKEPYKELDSGSETRDLSTDKIRINGKRYFCVAMFKGRSKGVLNIAGCGKNGDQLLKLSKNSFAQVYILQHVNKIEPEVCEALRDHIMAHSLSNDIKICIIDGTETARFLKGCGKDLEELKLRASNSGRKPKK